MKIYLFLLLSFLVNDYTFALNQDTIKFENLAGLIIIPVQVNGKLLHFMFDTGATRTVIREDITADLDKTKCSRKKLTDSHHNVTTQSRYVVQSLKIGTSDFSNQSIITFPDSPIFNCLGVEGAIGIDIIKQFDWLIDFDKQYIIKIDPSDTIKGYSDYVALDFYKKHLQPKIKLKIGNRSVNFLFDTGATENFIDKKGYRKIKNEIIKSFDENTSTSGASTFEYQSKESLIVFNTQPGNSDSNKHMVSFNTVSVGGNEIGNEFWGRSQVFFSWTKSKLLFRSTNTEKKKTFGVFLKIVNDSMVVSSLVFTCQIINSGLKQSDKVKSINGKTFTDNCELLRYQLLTKENALTIELQDGKKFTFKKESIY